MASKIEFSPFPNIQTSVPYKRDLKDIYKVIEERVCQVSTIKGKGSGILVGDKLVVIPFHIVEWIEKEKLTDGKTRVEILPIQIHYKGITYTAQINGVNLENAQYYDLCHFSIIDDDFSPLGQLSFLVDAPQPGEKVYFAGYPLNQTYPSFHKGVVCAVDPSQEVITFNIEGAALPGSSGGPVFINKQNTLLLAGMIVNEHANVDMGFFQARQIIKERMGDSTFTMGGVNLTTLMTKTMDTVFDNLSTGIVKVVSLKHFSDLGRETLPATPSPFSKGLPVMGGEQLPGQLATDKVYADWWHRRVKGKMLCVTILNKQFAAVDLIDKGDEKILRQYYEAHVLSSPTNGHVIYTKTVLEKYQLLKEKIDSATRKALKNLDQKTVWIKTLKEYKPQLPQQVNEIDGLINQLKV